MSPTLSEKDAEYSCARAGKRAVAGIITDGARDDPQIMITACLREAVEDNVSTANRCPTKSHMSARAIVMSDAIPTLKERANKLVEPQIWGCR